jgi:hypothetical protein
MKTSLQQRSANGTHNDSRQQVLGTGKRDTLSSAAAFLLILTRDLHCIRRGRCYTPLYQALAGRRPHQTALKTH